MPGLVPLYQFYIPGSVDHVLSTNKAETAGYDTSLLGYCAQNPGPLGQTALLRYFKAETSNHFATTKPGGENLVGYAFEGTLCYVK